MLEALRQVLDSPHVVSVTTIDVQAIKEKLLQLEGWAERDVDSLLAKVFDLRFDIPMFPSQELPGAFSEAREDEAQEPRHETDFLGSIGFAWRRFLVPTWTAWGAHADRTIVVKKGNWWREALGYVLLPISLVPLIMTDLIEFACREGYPPAYRDLKRREPLLSGQHVWSLAAPGLAALEGLAVWFAAVRIGDPMFGLALYVFAFPLLYPMFIMLAFSIMFRRDEKALEDYGSRVDVEEEAQARAELPPRLAGQRADDMQQARHWAKILRESPDIRASQEQALAFMAITPREYKQWRNRLRLALTLARGRGLFDDAQDVDMWARWTLIQERHPRVTEMLARSISEPEMQRQLDEEVESWPEADQLLFSQPAPLSVVSRKILLRRTT